MKKNYETPQLEVVEIEIEDAVLGASDTNSLLENMGQLVPGIDL